MNYTPRSDSGIVQVVLPSAEEQLKYPSSVMKFLIQAIAIPLNVWYIYTSRQSSTNIAYVKRILAISNIALSLAPMLALLHLAVVPDNMSASLAVTPTIFTGVWQSCLLLGVAVDRYIAVIRPLHYSQLVNKTRIVLFAVGTGLLALTLALLSLTIPNPSQTHRFSEDSDKLSTQSVDDVYSFEFRTYMNGLFWTALFMAIVMALLYTPVLVVIRKQRRAIEQQTAVQTQIESEPPEARSNSHKGTILLCASTVYFLLSYIPMIVFLSNPYLRSLPILDTRIQVWDMVGNIGMYSSCIVNPFLYGLNVKGCNKCFAST